MPLSTDDELTSAKQQLGLQTGESKILGLLWNKGEDTLSIQLGSPIPVVTKRAVLGRLAHIYDPLGIASPLALSGKQLQHRACDEKCAWDAELPAGQRSKYRRWEQTLPETVTVPLTLVEHREPIESAALHAFGDASGESLAAAVYAVLQQPSGTTQRLVAAKARLAKRGLTIPRLWLLIWLLIF